MKERVSQFSFIKVILCLLFMSIFLNIAHAKEQTLLNITKDEDDNVIKFIVDTNEQGDAKKFLRKTYSPEGELIGKPKKMDPEALFSESGLILERRKDYVVVTLRSENFAKHNGGHIEIDTLYNGASNDRESYEVELVRQGDQWEIVGKDNKTIESAHLKTNKVMIIGAVGIEDVIFK